MPAQRIKLQNVQALRGIAALMVVLYHLLVIEQKYGHGLISLPRCFNLGSAGVDIFFVISGFIMTVIIQGQFQQPQAIKHFLYNRVTRIYPIYWFYSLLVLLAFLLHPNWVNQSQGGHVDIIRSLLLLPQNQLPLVAVGWSLVYEMYFYLVITCLLFFPEKYLLKLLTAWLLFIVISRTLLQFNSATLDLITNPLTCEFIGGCFIARLCNYKKPMPIFLFVGIVLLLANFFLYRLQYNAPTGFARVFLYGLPSMLILYGVVVFEHKLFLTFPKILSTLGDASYSIYLSHVLVLCVLGRFWSSVRFDNLALHLCALVLMVAAVIIWSILSYNYIEKPLIHYFRKRLAPAKIITA